MPTFTIVRPADNTTLLTTTHLPCLPDARELAVHYSLGHVLLEDGRKTTAARRRELCALREKGE